MSRDWRDVFQIGDCSENFDEVHTNYRVRLATLPRPIDYLVVIELHEALRAAQHELGERWRRNVIYLR